MSDHPTTTVADAAAERQGSSEAALTLLAVIVVWYLGVAGLLLSHVF